MSKVYDVIINDIHVYAEASNPGYAIATAESELIADGRLTDRGLNEPGVTLEWHIVKN